MAEILYFSSVHCSLFNNDRSQDVQVEGGGGARTWAVAEWDVLLAEKRGKEKEYTFIVTEFSALTCLENLQN